MELYVPAPVVLLSRIVASFRAATGPLFWPFVVTDLPVHGVPSFRFARVPLDCVPPILLLLTAN